MAPNRQQAITWTNADPVHSCIYAAPEGDELILQANFRTNFLDDYLIKVHGEVVKVGDSFHRLRHPIGHWPQGAHWKK